MKLEEILMESKKIKYLTKKKKLYIEDITNEAILFYIEEEPKYSYFKKFKNKLNIVDTDLMYLHECVLRGFKFKNIFLLFEKRSALLVLKESVEGLKIIRDIYKKYNFLAIEDKKSLIELYKNNNLNNDILEKELEVKISDGKLLNASYFIEKESPYRSTILENVNSYKLLKKLDFNDHCLIVALIKRLFREKNYSLLNEMKVDINFKRIFCVPDISLESLAISSFFCGHKYDNYILKILDKEFVKGNIVECKKVLLLYKYNPFSKESTKKYILDNIWASDFIIKFFNMMKELLSYFMIEIVNELSLEVDCKIWTSFYRLIDRKQSININKLTYNEDFFRTYMKSSFFSSWMVREGVWYLDDTPSFISKFTKRSDFEFYLTVLHPDFLETYHKNNVGISTEYKPHMKIYNKILKSSDDVYRMLSNDVTEYFNTIPDHLLLQKIINFFDLENLLYYETIISFLQEVLEYNSQYKIRCINQSAWNLLIQKPDLFKRFLHKFCFDEDSIQRRIIEHNFKCTSEEERVKLEDLERYKETSFEDEVLKYITSLYNAKEIMDMLLSKFEDERRFYYKALMRKKEFDRRIFLITTDGDWIERIIILIKFLFF